MIHWIKEAIAAARVIRQVRKSGETEKLALVQEAELKDSREWLAKRDYENQLMQQCIAGMIEGRSPCWWCEECKECKRKEHMSPKGCKEWWLRFLTEQEERRCIARAATPGPIYAAGKEEAAYEQTAAPGDAEAEAQDAKKIVPFSAGKRAVEKRDHT